MDITGMYMLNAPQYNPQGIRRALGMLYVDRKNEFRELGQVLLSEKAFLSMPHWKEFVLNFSLGVEESFKSWSGQEDLDARSPQKALTILRQLGHDLTSMNQLAHHLNMAYNLSVEFKEIYKRLR